jgi:hypothetical protein
MDSMTGAGIKAALESGGDLKDFPTFCPYRGEADHWYPCIGTGCEKGKTGVCLRS